MDNKIDQLKQLRLSEIDEVIHLDKIGANGLDCAFLVYLDGPEPILFGTNNFPHNPNDLIHHLLMRIHNINMSEAIHMAIKDKPSVVMEEWSTMIAYISDYVIYH